MNTPTSDDQAFAQFPYFVSPINDIALRSRTASDVWETHWIRSPLNAVYRILLNESFLLHDLGG